MILVEAVTYSDVIVLDFLKKKAPQGEDVPLRIAEIILGTGIPECTVRRALSRLHRAGLIDRTRTYDCYTFKVNNGNSSATA